MDIEIGDITIRSIEVTSTSMRDSSIRAVATISRIMAKVSAYSEGVEIDANLELVEECHPDLKEPCATIREYMKREAERLLGEQGRGGG